MGLSTSEQDKRVERIARHATEFLSGFLNSMEHQMREAEPIRNRILADLRALNEDASAADRERIHQQIAEQTQLAFAALGAARVDFDDGCVGRGGGGVTVSQGGTTVKGCVIVEGQTVQGGGIEVSTTY
jgi:hypothetical protein